ncbi:MAG TPA: HAMP domain-containing sensor histidine kinase [Patescibacteria group bacterium]|nr:HAMP domain-containing sensor histidine kinase [Patescibacteria group bacterium]
MPFASRVEPIVCADGQLEPMLDASPYAVLYAGADARVLAASRAVGTFFGIEPGAMIGKRLDELADAWGRSFAEFMSFHEVLAHPMEDREGEFMRDVEIVAPARRFLEIASAPVRKAGAYAGRLWLMRDVTHEREITELKIQYGGLRSADEIKSKFLTVASHQLRTPLNAIRWNLELLLSEGAALPPETADALRSIYRSVTTSISIVDDMLLAVDIEQRTLRLDRSAVDIADVVGKVVRDYARSAQMRSQTLSYADPAPRPAPLFVDAGKMETVFSRLIDNAIKYTPDGGRITVGIRSGKDEVEIEVRDNGIGMPEKEHARLFERFYRSKKAIDVNPNASGLGLYIAKFIVDAHDGRIGCRTREGEGTTFTVTLPRRAPV